jgi:voltage-gated potassium channel
VDQFRDVRRRLAVVAAALVGSLIAGTLGYRLLEGWSLFDGLYMTVITLATVGYGETHPLSTTGRAFTMLLILVGVGVAAYAFSTLTAIIVEGDLSQAFRRRRMEKDIAKLSGHFIVCGAGHTGGVVCAELLKTGRELVIVDRDAEALAKLAERLGAEVPHVVGDGSEDEVLRRAGIERAAGVFAVLATDQDNAFVALSAKGLNPRTRVLACQKTLGVREKLLRSGADGVVDPEFIGGMRLASEMIRPATVGFLDAMLRERSVHVRFDEIALTDGSPAVGRTVGAYRAPGEPLLVAVVAPGAEQYEINPPSERPLRAGDRLVMIGEAGALQELRQRMAGSSNH